jgi:hypothetical protein
MEVDMACKGKGSKKGKGTKKKGTTGATRIKGKGEKNGSRKIRQ